jgi:hypothetical protein
MFFKLKSTRTVMAFAGSKLLHFKWWKYDEKSFEKMSFGSDVPKVAG